MKKQRDIKVTVIYTPGWEDRVAKAAYDLYLRLEAKEKDLQTFKMGMPINILEELYKG